MFSKGGFHNILTPVPFHESASLNLCGAAHYVEEEEEEELSSTRLNHRYASNAGVQSPQRRGGGFFFFFHLLNASFFIIARLQRLSCPITSVYSLSCLIATNEMDR